MKDYGLGLAELGFEPVAPEKLAKINNPKIPKFNTNKGGVNMPGN